MGEIVPSTSLRCCWQQVRLGRSRAEGLQQKGLCGNTIFFAQPTADIPSMELPPAPDGLLDSFNIILTRSVGDLSKAEWATVKRAEYMRIVRERKAQCPVFAHVVLGQDTRLPECGVPEHISACAQTVDGAEYVPRCLDGPASRAPEISKNDEAQEASESCASEDDDAPETAGAPEPAEGKEPLAEEDSIAEACIAVDPVHHLKPVKLIQALQANLATVQQHAERVAKNEGTPTIADQQGNLQAVRDEGGRQVLKTLVLDAQAVAKSFGEKERVELENATTQAGDVQFGPPPQMSRKSAEETFASGAAQPAEKKFRIANL